VEDLFGRLAEAPQGAEPYEDPDLGSSAEFQARSARSGAEFKQIALEFVRTAGGSMTRPSHEIDGYLVDAEITGSNGRRFLLLARGTPDEGKEAGLRRQDTIQKLGYCAGQIAHRQHTPLLIVTSDLPEIGKPRLYLADMGGFVWDVVAWRGDLRGQRRLTKSLTGPLEAVPPDAPWRQRRAEPASGVLEFPDLSIAGDKASEAEVNHSA
jgi:hypothetical protein